MDLAPHWSCDTIGQPLSITNPSSWHKEIGVDVWVRNEIPLDLALVKEAIEHYLEHTIIEGPGIIDHSHAPEIIQKSVHEIKIDPLEEIVPFPISAKLDNINLNIHLFCLELEPPNEEVDDSGEFTAFHILPLPNILLHGLWDSLFFDHDLKRNLINYVKVSMLFTQHDIDQNTVSWNRVLLLHGPPGTGKTSLCKALAQYLSIRFQSQYRQYQLVEINAHSLFSKWFSESGKLVMKLFSSIREMIEDERRFVILLIDEVESLTAARTRAVSGSEPFDALRVVNAVLTELDRLRHCKNVMIFTTSNLSQSIDEAFLDRADMIQYIGMPCMEARVMILNSCVKELREKKMFKVEEDEVETDERIKNGIERMASISNGVSARRLRRLPFITYALALCGRPSGIGLFLDQMAQLIQSSQGMQVMGNNTSYGCHQD